MRHNGRLKLLLTVGLGNVGQVSVDLIHRLLHIHIQGGINMVAALLNRQYQYARTVYQGIVSSVNTISVGTLDKIGYDYAYSFAKYNLGQQHLVESYDAGGGQTLSDLDRAPLALGALTVGSTVRDMSAAYATFASDGVYSKAGA